jgi:multidrug efflux pump subunit AcrB
MVSGIHINTDADSKRPEIRISGSPAALADLGMLLKSIDRSVEIAVAPIAVEHYAVGLTQLAVLVDEAGSSRLTITTDDATLRLKGSRTGLAKLGESLTNFFDADTRSGEHFHLDPYEGNPLLEEASCALVVISE